MSQKVVIDTDFGTDADDAIAVALAMASEEIEVQAFTVVGRQSVYRRSDDDSSEGGIAIISAGVSNAISVMEG